MLKTGVLPQSGKTLLYSKTLCQTKISSNATQKTKKYQFQMRKIGVEKRLSTDRAVKTTIMESCKSKQNVKKLLKICLEAI